MKKPSSNDAAALRVPLTLARKNAYVKAARPGKLLTWMFKVMDEAAGYLEMPNHTGLKYDEWVVSPMSNRRGKVIFIHEQSNGEPHRNGRLVTIDFGNKSVNLREFLLNKSADQESKWADKPYETENA